MCMLGLVYQLWCIAPVNKQKKNHVSSVSMVYRMVNHLGFWKNT